MTRATSRILIGLLTAFLILIGSGWPIEDEVVDGTEVVSCVLALVAIGRDNLSAAADGALPADPHPQVSIPECEPLSPSAYDLALEVARERLAS